MKKFFWFFNLILSSFLLLSCHSNNDNSTTNNKIETNNILIVYFSCSNNTEAIAYKIQNNLQSNIFEIIPLDPYTEEDLNYNDDSCRANQEQNDDNCRPQISNPIVDFNQYDSFFIGYPIWWGKLPKIMYTFFETYDFSDKNIIPFCTSGGSGITTSVNEIKQLEPNANVDNGKRFSSSDSQETINQWLLEFK